MIIKDTYFFDSKEALKVANQLNKINNNKYTTQLCYYNGEKINSSLNNLKHLPIECIIDNLSVSKFRISL